MWREWVDDINVSYTNSQGWLQCVLMVSHSMYYTKCFASKSNEAYISNVHLE